MTLKLAILTLVTAPAAAVILMTNHIPLTEYRTVDEAEMCAAIPVACEDSAVRNDTAPAPFDLSSHGR